METSLVIDMWMFICRYPGLGCSLVSDEPATTHIEHWSAMDPRRPGGSAVGRPELDSGNPEVPDGLGGLLQGHTDRLSKEDDSALGWLLLGCLHGRFLPHLHLEAL